jgi:hypothetical protein
LSSDTIPLPKNSSTDIASGPISSGYKLSIYKAEEMAIQEFISSSMVEVETIINIAIL